MDIVERLRGHVTSRLPGQAPAVRNGAWDMMLEAADEIARLRAEVERLRAFIKTTQKADCNCQQCAEARAALAADGKGGSS